MRTPSDDEVNRVRAIHQAKRAVRGPEPEGLELVEARCDVETVERLRQSYGEGDRMSNIEQTHGRGTRWIALRAALVPPLDESDLRAALADTAVEVEFVPAPPEGAVGAIKTLRAAVAKMQGGADPSWLQDIGQDALDATAEWGQ